jgi:FecR protein
MLPRELIMEVSDLALRASDERLSTAQRNRLNDLLESQEDACRALLFCGIMEAELAVYSSEEAAQDRALEAITSNASANRWTPPDRRLPRRRDSRFSRWFVPAALICLCLCAAIPFLTREKIAPSAPSAPSSPVVNLAKRVPQTVGSLKSAPDAKFAVTSPHVGDSFTEGDVVVLDSGEAHVSMASGAEFILKGPAKLKFNSANHVELRNGVLTAHVAAWGSGFTVDTSEMRVVDLGTKFAVSASSEDVETHVLQGQVRVQPLASTVTGRRSVLLTKGEGIRVDTGADEPIRFAAQTERFPETTEKFRPFKPVALFNTGIALAEGDEDPHWRISAGPKGASFKKPQFAVVCTPDERYASNEPQRSQWLSFAKDVRPGGMPNSVYTFETTFDLTGFDPSTVVVAAQILADNGVHALRINGRTVPMVPWDDNDFAQTFKSDQFRLAEIREGFVPGRNKIEIDVWNGTYRMPGSQHDPNPMALRVEFQGFGRLSNRRETVTDNSRKPVSGPVGAI